MSLPHLILGYLSWRPMSALELKTLIADSEILPWTASSNKIYRALVDLHKQGLAVRTEDQPADSEEKSVYAITGEGQAALKKWVSEPVGPPQTGESFLHQLLWADALDHTGLGELIEAYRHQVGEKLFFLRVQADEKPDQPGRTDREKYVWEMVYRNWIAHYELELKWVGQLQNDFNL